MKRLIAASLLLIATACSAPHPRTVEDFNFDWRFTLSDDPAYAATEYDDSRWRSLHLPHDWAIEGEFSADNPSTAGGGALPGGIGWYRKHFTAPEAGYVSLEFDGVFMNSTVWVNGQQVGHRPYGYSSFSYDITPYLVGGENVVAVRCDNAQQPNSRWYSGCGIYRNVRLVATDPLHIAYSGTYVTTPEIDARRAVVGIEATLENCGSEDRKATLRHRILDAEGRCVAQTEAEVLAPADRTTVSECLATIETPRHWNPESPYLYTVETTVEAGGRTVDDYRTPLGIRTFRFTADNGLFFNGRHLDIKGVCLHHDLGALGSAVHVRALERQLEILRGMGCNAIRTSHNPPAPELLDLCDRMGFLVMDEAFDMWRKRKTTYDYSLYFDQWYERDLSDFIRRDRNHPSIIVWSIGNEILEQWNHNEDNGELGAEQANLLLNFLKERPAGDAGGLNPNVLLTMRLAELTRSLDPTRPLTAGCNEPRPHNNLLRSGALDIVGFNYANDCYDSVRTWYPDKPFIGTETVSSTHSRGYYVHPSGKTNVQPAHWWEVYDTPHHQCSAYDNSHVPWGVTHERSIIDLRQRPFIAGQFIWTGFDYLGEPTPYSWPSRSSYFGVIDLAGFPKDAYYLYRAEWSDLPTLHLFPHWNWQPGQAVDLWVYYNNADEVELLVNGRSQGRRAKSDDRLHCRWEGIAFEPGEITAIAYKEGRETARTTRRTAGPAAELRLTADRSELHADGYDLAFVTVEALDAQGNPCPTSSERIVVEVEGAAELAGIDNGNAAAHDCLKGERIDLFNGKALVVVRTLRDRKGPATLRVSSGERMEARLELKAQ